MKGAKKDIAKIKPQDKLQEEYPESYTISFRYLEKENTPTNGMLQKFKEINEGNVKDIQYKHIAKKTTNEEYEALYENLERQGVERENIHEIVLQRSERIFFYKVKIENNIILSIIKMTKKHLKYKKQK